MIKFSAINDRKYYANVSHGRSRFFLHEGKKPGSAGCIDIGNRDGELFPQLGDLNAVFPLLFTTAPNVWVLRRLFYAGGIEMLGLLEFVVLAQHHDQVSIKYAPLLSHFALRARFS